jgi:hypothetical protein
MATNNFYNKNASAIFAVLMNYEQPILDDDGNETDDTEHVSPESWEYDDLILELQSAMQTKFGRDYVKGGQDDRDRNFYGTAIGRYLLDKTYMGVTIEIELTAMIRSGYYEGANLDWDITLHVDGYSHDDVPDALAEWEYQAEKEYNAGLVKANLRHVKLWTEKTCEAMRDSLEEIFAEYSDVKLRKVGQFSNGEAVYERV